MTTAADKTQCVICEKEETATSRCIGCSQEFCSDHLTEHRQELKKQLDEIEGHRDLFLQTTDSQKHSVIKEIDQWEHESIEKIKQTAEEIRQIVSIHINENMDPTKDRLNKLTDQLKQSREQDEIIETDLQKWKEELQQIREQLNRPSNIIIQKSSIALINKIQVEFPAPISTSVTNVNAKWMQNGVTVAGGNSQGNRNNQLSNPWSVYVDDDQTIYVADYSNHRIVEWKKDATTGQIVAGVKEAGNRNDQLNSPANVIVDKKNDYLIISDRGNQRVVRWPRRNGTSGETIISNVDCYGLSIDDDGYIYVSDVNKHEVRRWKIGETNGTLVAGGNEKGDRLDQLKQPYHIFVDQDHSVYVSDWGNHRVMKWMQGAKEGILVAGGQNLGDRLTQLSGPRGIIVDQKGDLYVADQNNHRVMRWVKEATEGTVVVGGNKPGGQANQFNTPVGLSFDQQNNLYVVDQGNQRIQKFNIESNPTS